jgi:hypothetical protein
LKEITDFMKKAEKFLKTAETTDAGGDHGRYPGDGSRVGRVAG